MTYRYTDPDGHEIETVPETDWHGKPVITFWARGEFATVPVRIPADRVEELIAGIRDTILHGEPAPAVATQATEEECCGAEPLREITTPDGKTWLFGDCWCTLKPHRTGEHRCQPCTDRHGAPGWTDQPTDQTEEQPGA